MSTPITIKRAKPGLLSEASHIIRELLRVSAAKNANQEPLVGWCVHCARLGAVLHNAGNCDCPCHAARTWIEEHDAPDVA